MLLLTLVMSASLATSATEVEAEKEGEDTTPEVRYARIGVTQAAFVQEARWAGTEGSETRETNSESTRHRRGLVQAGYVRSSRWSSTTIPVCWENPGTHNKRYRGWVRESVTRTWEAHSGLRFVGWSRCAPDSRGIRILIADIGPHVKQLGALIDGVPQGMVLNFDFVRWEWECQFERELCIRSIAVHEFGHAIGLTHEQNRHDTPGECRGMKQGRIPDATLTPFDPNSVMNYCNRRWNNHGQLSELDRQAVNQLYPRKR